MKRLEDLRLQNKDEWRAFNDQRKKKFKGLKIGIKELDEQVLGLTGIVGIQGEPGACKSTLALQIAIHNSQTGVPVLLIDRENGSSRLRRRALCAVYGIAGASVDQASDETIVRWYNDLGDLPFYVDHDGCTPDDVRSYLAEIWQIHQSPMVLVVDSLQALGPVEGMDERMSLQTWLSELDQLKLDYRGNLVIIITSEKKRGAYGEASKEGGKGTGSIEYKCELLFDIREDKDSGLLFLDLVKNRDGATFKNNSLSRMFASSDPNSFIFKLSHHGYGDDDQF